MHPLDQGFDVQSIYVSKQAIVLDVDLDREQIIRLLSGEQVFLFDTKDCAIRIRSSELEFEKEERESGGD